MTEFMHCHIFLHGATKHAPLPDLQLELIYRKRLNHTYQQNKCTAPQSEHKEPATFNLCSTLMLFCHKCVSSDKINASLSVSLVNVCKSVLSFTHNPSVFPSGFFKPLVVLSHKPQQTAPKVRTLQTTERYGRKNPTTCLQTPTDNNFFFFCCCCCLKTKQVHNCYLFVYEKLRWNFPPKTAESRYWRTSTY